MGAWGYGNFNNDDALDWLSEFESTGAEAAAEELESVSDMPEDEYLEAPQASAAVAAAAIVAAARDGDLSKLPQDARDALAQHRDYLLDPQLAEQARRAVARIARQSELKELWEQGTGSGKWSREIADLSLRLSSRKAAGLAALRRILANIRQIWRGPTASHRTPFREFTPGMVLRLKTSGGNMAYAVMLEESPFIAFYRDDAIDVAELRFIDKPMFIVCCSAYFDPGWGEVIARMPQGSLPAWPRLFRQNMLNHYDCTIDYPDGHSETTTPADCVGIERNASWAAEHIDSRIDDFYAGRPNAEVELMKVTIPPPR